MECTQLTSSLDVTTEPAPRDAKTSADALNSLALQVNEYRGLPKDFLWNV